ncbi:MAG: tRNA (adenosine(37)-N6)-threonylcarbamoyltransferase complex ATPase subunit type 1 TsaE [Anaerolineae bacterium]
MKKVNFSLKTSTDGVASTEALGESIGAQLQIGDVICLIGGLGAGKTALTRGIGRGWGTTHRVTSPTFTLVNEYARKTDSTILYHLDCYRLMSADDVETIGLDDILSADGAVIIEWPQVAAEWLPEDYLWIEISIDSTDFADDDSRQFIINAYGPRSQAILNQLIN